MANLRWKVITVLAVLVDLRRGRRLSDRRRALRHHSAGMADRQGAQARARSQGRRAPRAARPDRRCAAASRPSTEMERLREALRTAQHHRRPTSPRPTRRSSRSKACRRHRTPRSARSPPRSRPTSTATPASNGTYTFTMKPNVQVTLREEAVVQARADDRAPRQRARRHRAEHRAAGQPAAIRSWCSCPASPTSTARRRSSARPGCSS